MANRSPGPRKVAKMVARAREVIAELDAMPMGDSDQEGRERARALAEELAALAKVPEVQAMLDELPDAQGRTAKRGRSSPIGEPGDANLVMIAGAVQAVADRLARGDGTQKDREALRAISRAWYGMGAHVDDPKLSPIVQLAWLVEYAIKDAREGSHNGEWLRDRCMQWDARFANVSAREWKDAASGQRWPGSTSDAKPPDTRRAAHIVLIALGKGQDELERRELARSLARDMSNQRSKRGE